MQVQAPDAGPLLARESHRLVVVPLEALDPVTERLLVVAGQALDVGSNPSTIRRAPSRSSTSASPAT
jgi:hypothetical protein